MKKTLIGAILISTMSLQSFAEETSEKHYSDALTAYKSKDYSTSYEILSKLYLSKLSDASFSFKLGRSAYETGHYEIALAAFERVDMLDAGNLRNKLEMARTYFMLKMYEDAEMTFKEVLKNQSIPKSVRNNIELYLSKVTKVQERSFTYATAGLDMIYDSNINYGSLESEYDIGGIVYPTLDEKSGGALQVYGDVTNIYDIGDKNDFAIKNRLSIFSKIYINSNHSDYNINYIAYNPSFMYQERKYLVELEAGFDLLTLGGKDYQHILSLSPKIEWNHTTTLKSLSYFKYADKSFQQNMHKDLDATHYEFAYALQNILSPRSYVQGKFIAIMEEKKHGNRIDVDYSDYRFDVNYANQFSETYGADFFAELRQRTYNDASNLFQNTREDTAGIISATLNTKIRSFVLKLNATYNRVDSNQAVYSYDKTTITAGIVKTY